MNRRRNRSIAANPTLVGAVTTLVIVVAVFLAYNANNGLPFVPTQQLKLQISSGANLLPGNEVREGGKRIGIVSDMRPVRLPDGTTGAEIVMKIDQDAGDVPRDSRIALRPRSVLGLKYVQLTRGTSSDTFADGDTLPSRQASFPVELDELYSTFDEKTRNASRENLQGFGNTFARRGEALNRAIADLPRLLGSLAPVARVLADEKTQLPRFFKELGDAARVVAPVSDRYAHQFGAAADTFEAWSRDPEKLAQTIRRSAPTLDAGIRSFRLQRPFLADFAAMSESLKRAVVKLPRTLPRLIPAIEAGTPVQKRMPGLNKDLRGALAAMDRLGTAPTTAGSLRALQDTTSIVNPLMKFVGPYVTVCNYFNYAFTHLGEHLTEPDPTGTSQRTLLILAPRTANPLDPSVGSSGASKPANGELTLNGPRMNLHTSAYGAAVDRAGNADCESGQRGYLQRVFHYGDRSLNIAVDPHIPGNQGTTFTGRPRVPAGQTFSRTPLAGPAMDPRLDP